MLEKRYEIIEKLSEGSFGAVYLAKDKNDGKKVAIKKIKREMAKKINIGRLAREFYLMSKNRSPYIADVHEFNSDVGEPYYVMEYLDGITLEEMLDDENYALAPEKAGRLIINLAAGLERIHSTAVIHGDLKPSNIILQRQGDDLIPKIVDFGLAYTKDTAGDISGSIGWMAPELLLGKSSGIQADIYSFAVIALQILTGINPFIAQSASETIERHLELTPQIPKVGLLADNNIRQILMNMLSKTPHQRPSSAYFLRVAISKKLGITPSGKPEEIFLPNGDPMLERQIKFIIDNIVKVSGKVFVECVIDDDTRFTRFIDELQPELAIRNFSWFDLNNPELCAKKLLSDVLASEPEKKSKSMLYEKAREFRGRFGEYLTTCDTETIDMTDFLSYLIDVLEEYSLNVPQVVNIVGIKNSFLIERLKRLKRRGKMIILSDDVQGDTEPLAIENFSINMTENFILSILSPYIGDKQLHEIIHRETHGHIGQIDIKLRQMIAQEIIVQSEDGWIFDAKEYNKKKGVEDYTAISGDELLVLRTLLAAEIKLPIEILAQIMPKESLYPAIHSLLRLGLVLESDSEAYYGLSDINFAKTIAGDIADAVYISLAEAIEKAGATNPDYLALRLKAYSISDESGSWISLAEDTLKTLKSRKSYEAMLSIYELMANHYLKINDPAKAFGNLKRSGLMCKYLGYFTEANGYYEKALAIAKEIGRADMHAAIMNDIGVIHFESGNLELALWYYQESAKVAEIDDSKKFILLGWTNIAGCLHLLYRFEEAEEYYRKALDFAEDSEYSIFAPVLSYNLGEMRYMQYDINDAKRLFNRALTLAKQGGQESALFESMVGIARLQLHTGARRNLEKTVAEIEKMTDIIEVKRYQAALMLLKFEIAICRGDYNELESCLQTLQKIYTHLSSNMQCNISRLAIIASFLNIEAVDEYDFYELEPAWEDYRKLPETDIVANEKELDSFYEKGDFLGYTAMAIKLSQYLIPANDVLEKAIKRLPVRSPFLEGLLFQTLGNVLIDDKAYDDGIKQLNQARVAYGKAGNEERLAQVERKIGSIKKDEVAIAQNEIVKLLEIIRGINENLDFDEVIRRILTEVIRLSGADRGIVFINQDNSPSVKMVMDENGNRIPDKRIKYSHSIVEDVFTCKCSILKESVLTDEEISSRESVMALDIKMVFCIPLIFDDTLLGAIYTDSKIGSDAFSDARRSLLEALATNAAIAIHNAMTHSNLLTENLTLRESFNEHFGGDNIIGQSLPMRKLYHKLSLITGEDVTVLLTGETGTGKDLIARMIHKESPRGSKPFIAINCAALPDTLLESELFGYEKGAFTGATLQKKGKFDLANGGTIFLNEIGEMPLALQAKLLSVLETKTFQRLGGTQDISVDARIIAATNRELDTEVEEGRFRADLFYRLSVVRLNVPSLRERREDIPALIRFFIEKVNEKTSRNIKGIEPKALDFMLSCEWHGNVRELQNVIEEMSLFSASDYLTLADIPTRLRKTDIVPNKTKETATTYKELKKMKEDLERESIISVLNLHEWNVAEAAKHFGIDRTRLHQLITKYGLRGYGK